MIYPRGNVWYIGYSAHGLWVREAVGESKKMAEAVLRKRKTEVIEGKFFDMKNTKKIHFSDFADEYLKVHSSNNKSYRKDVTTASILKKFFGVRYLQDITSMDVERFKTERAKTVSVATTNRGLALLKSMFNRAIEWRKVKENPCKPVKLFKENNQILRYLEHKLLMVLH